MYFDIKHIESVDEFGNKRVELQAVFTAPVYDDITPNDMSLTNQQKAGVNMERVQSRSRCNLETADKAESSLFAQGESIELIESTPSPEPISSPGSISSLEPTSSNVSSKSE